MSKLIDRLEYAIFVSGICVISAGILGFYVKLFGGAPPLPIEAIYLPVILGMIAVIALRLRESVFGLMSVLPYFFLMVFALASYRWSLNPSFTIREALISIISEYGNRPPSSAEAYLAKLKKDRRYQRDVY